MGIVKSTLDGWANLLTSLGVRGRDKRLGAEISWEPLGELEAEELYAQDDVAATIVDYLPDEMTREWIELKGEAAQNKKFEDRLTQLSVKSKSNEGLKWARMYGGAALLVITDDQNLELPLTKFSQIKQLQLLSRWELKRADLDTDLASPNFGNPLTYRLSSTAMQGNALKSPKIHYSRVIRFEGVKLGRRLRTYLDYWGDSSLTRCREPILNYQTSHNAAVTALQDFSVGVFKLKNLANLVASGQEEDIKKRIAIAEMSKSVLHAMLIDEDETYENVTRNLTGVPEILEKSTDRLVSASRMPHNILLGDSSKGLGSTGESEQTTWYDFVSSVQEKDLRPILDRVMFLLAMELKTEAPPFDFKPLWQMTEEEQAGIRKTQSETDKNYVDTGVLDPGEVAKSRFGGPQWSAETVLNDKARARSMPSPEDLGD